VDGIPQDEVDKIVAYSMVYNRYAFGRLPDVLASGKWDTLKSVKKKTPYYETLHREAYKGDSIWVTNPTTYNGWSGNDNNYKYLPFYMTRNFSSKTSADYEAFYPASSYTGKNVQAASVLAQDISASNGIAHEVNGVNEPLPTLEDMLRDERYSTYRALLEVKNGTNEPFFYTYGTNTSVNEYYKNMYPSRNIDNVYIKAYNVPFEFLRTSSQAVAIPLNVERYFLSGQEEDGYTLYAPNNAAMEKFADEVVRPYGYESVAELPSNVLSYFVNAQMGLNLIWPSEYRGARNVYENFINGEGRDGTEFSPLRFPDLRPASNGLFYGSNDYVKSHYFESVLTEVLMRRTDDNSKLKYIFMYNALDKHFYTTLMEDFVKCPLNGYTQENYTVLLPSDEQLQGEGFSWIWPAGSNAYEFRHTNTAFTAGTRMQRLVRSYVFKRIKSADIDTRMLDFAGDPAVGYDGYAYAVNDYGDMLRYKDNEVELTGDYLAGEKVRVTKVKTFSNGQVFTMDKLPQFSYIEGTGDGSKEEIPTLADCLEKAKIENPNISTAADLLIYLLTSRTVGNTTYAAKMAMSAESFWTLLLPNNDRMAELLNMDERIQTGEINDVPQFSTRKIYLNLAALKRQEESGELADVVLNWSKCVTDFVNFFRYHTIPGTLYLNDGYDHVLFNNGTVQRDAVAVTSYKDGLNSTFVRISKDFGDGNNLQFTTYDMPEMGTRTASVTRGVTRSNLFGPQAVIHEVDNYLFYRIP
jgi:hypothetical protein